MTMANARCRKTDAALLVGFCVLASILSLDLFPIYHAPLSSSSSPEVRRNLKAKTNRRASRRMSTKSVYSWAEDHLRPVTETPGPLKETVLFWHIPKSGGTTTKAIYECLGQTLASRAGSLPQFGHDHDLELIAFHPWRADGPSYVNVDTSSPAGIVRAQKMGLVPSGLADLIMTGFPTFAIEHLYDKSHKGRALGLFRHPVDRLVSKFYYLQVADWERTYHPSWKGITVLEFAEKRNNDNNFMVKKLVGKTMNEKVTEEDLQLAMNILKKWFVVGLVNEMEESIRRFNIVMGVDETGKENKECMDQFFGHGVEKKNTNSHPEEKEGSPAWTSLAKRNALDIRLYDFILHLFEEQKKIIDSYAETMALKEE